MKKILLFTVSFFTLMYAMSQNDNTKVTQPEMADAMRNNGKIYVVVACLVLVFIGIIIYLLRIEKKINNLEKQ